MKLKLVHANEYTLSNIFMSVFIVLYVYLNISKLFIFFFIFKYDLGIVKIF
mgnify:CR=1 FL=1